MPSGQPGSWNLRRPRASRCGGCARSLRPRTGEPPTGPRRVRDGALPANKLNGAARGLLAAHCHRSAGQFKIPLGRPNPNRRPVPSFTICLLTSTTLPVLFASNPPPSRDDTTTTTTTTTTAAAAATTTTHKWPVLVFTSRASLSLSCRLEGPPTLAESVTLERPNFEFHSGRKRTAICGGEDALGPSPTSCLSSPEVPFRWASLELRAGGAYFRALSSSSSLQKPIPRSWRR